MQQGEELLPPLRTPTHRAIFDDEDLYTIHTRLSIASYLIVQNDRFLLNPNKRVDLSSRDSSRMDVMSIQPLVHSLHLWYYPPHVKDIYSHFETAARRYADRLDTFMLTKGLKRTLDKRENQRADEGRFFFFWIRSGDRSRCFFRWSQGQEGKVRCSTIPWCIKQPRTAMTS